MDANEWWVVPRPLKILMITPAIWDRTRVALAPAYLSSIHKGQPGEADAYASKNGHYVVDRLLAIRARVRAPFARSFHHS